MDTQQKSLGKYHIRKSRQPILFSSTIDALKPMLSEVNEKFNFSLINFYFIFRPFRAYCEHRKIQMFKVQTD